MLGQVKNGTNNKQILHFFLKASLYRAPQIKVVPEAS